MKKILLFFVLLLLIQCGDDPNPANDVLPPVTTSGANTFGCRVDGRILIPKRKPNYSEMPSVEKLIVRYGTVSNSPYFADGTHLKISAWNQYTSENLDIELQAGTQALEQGQTYPIQTSISGKIVGKYYVFSGSGYESTDAIPGQLKILKLDTTNKIISGTFSFEAKKVSGSGKNAVSVTEGRFDAIYESYY